MRWVCARCQSEYTDRPPTCGTCLGHDLLVPLPDRIEGRTVTITPRRRVGVVSAGALRSEGRLAPLGEPFASAWKLGDPFCAELLGEPGGGKSTCAAKMAVSAARRVDVLLVSAEEGHSIPLADRLRRAGLDDMTVARLRVTDARTMNEVREDLAHDAARLVILDSVTEMKATAEEVVTAMQGRSWIVVSQVNVRGQSYGGQTMSHAVDALIDVAKGVATPRKNRFGGMSPVDVWKEQEAA